MWFAFQANMTHRQTVNISEEIESEKNTHTHIVEKLSHSKHHESEIKHYKIHKVSVERKKSAL